MSACQMLRKSSIPTAGVGCHNEATHLVPSALGGRPVAMCDRCFLERLEDNNGDESGVIYLTHAAFLASLDRLESSPLTEGPK